MLKLKILTLNIVVNMFTIFKNTPHNNKYVQTTQLKLPLMILKFL